MAERLKIELVVTGPDGRRRYAMETGVELEGDADTQRMMLAFALRGVAELCLGPDHMGPPEWVMDRCLAESPESASFPGGIAGR